MSGYREGQVLKVTRREGTEPRMMIYGRDAVEDREFIECLEDVHEVRQVVVIDPSNSQEVQELTDVIRQAFRDAGLAYLTMAQMFSAEHTGTLSVALQAFAKPAPTAPEEPTGRYAVVYDGTVTWVRAGWASHRPWNKIGTDAWAEYGDIGAVLVLSPGTDAEEAA